MAGAGVGSLTSSGPPFLLKKVVNSCDNSGWQLSRCSCGSLGEKLGVVMRSCWLGAERKLLLRSRACRKRGPSRRFQVRSGFEELLHNQVLVSSSAAGILGQLAKPFSIALLRGKGFNWRLISASFNWRLMFKSGGMPSTHSATVTAAATALGMERGLSDSLFGLSVLLACLVMYDAQGVRRAVGKQAEVINTMVFTHMARSVPSQSAPLSTSTPTPSPYAIGVELAQDPVQAELEFMGDAGAPIYESSKSTAVIRKESSVRVNGTKSSRMRLAEGKPGGNGALGGAQTSVEGIENLPSVKEGEVTPQEFGSSDGWRHIPLKESVGHTKVEVLVGAIWGIVIALALHSSIQ